MATVGLLHPGEMGAAVGGCLVSVGHEVLWDPGRAVPGHDRARAGRRADRGEVRPAHREVLGDLLDLPAARGPRRRAPGRRRRVRRALRRRQRDLGRDRRAGRRRSSPPRARPMSTAGSSASRPRSPATPGCTCPAPRASEVARAVRPVPRSTRGSPKARCTRPRRSRWPTRRGPRAPGRCCSPAARWPVPRGVERTLLEEWGLSQPALAGSNRACPPTRRRRRAGDGLAEMEEIAASMGRRRAARRNSTRPPPRSSTGPRGLTNRRRPQVASTHGNVETWTLYVRR